MNMPYQLNPNLPKVRAEAVKMVCAGHSTREVARHFGFSQSAVFKWCQKVHPEVRQFRIIPTESSRLQHHPKELDETLVARILELRDTTYRGAAFIRVLLQRDGVAVSPWQNKVFEVEEMAPGYAATSAGGTWPATRGGYDSCGVQRWQRTLHLHHD